MRARGIVILDIRRHYSPQMRFAKNDQMIKAFAADRADHAFDITVLPRRVRGDGMITNPHVDDTSSEDFAKCLVIVTDQNSRRRIPGKGFSDLVSQPFGGRMTSDSEPNDPSSPMSEDDKDIKTFEGDRRHDEEIDGCDSVGMILQERLPSLRRRSSAPDHVFGDRRLRDLKTELE